MLDCAFLLACSVEAFEAPQILHLSRFLQAFARRFHECWIGQPRMALSVQASALNLSLFPDRALLMLTSGIRGFACFFEALLALQRL
jgi:hypothetical protein